MAAAQTALRGFRMSAPLCHRQGSLCQIHSDMPAELPAGLELAQEPIRMQKTARAVTPQSDWLEGEYRSLIGWRASTAYAYLLLGLARQQRSVRDEDSSGDLSAERAQRGLRGTGSGPTHCSPQKTRELATVPYGTSLLMDKKVL